MSRDHPQGRSLLDSRVLFQQIKLQAAPEPFRGLFYPPTQAFVVGLRIDLPAPVRRLPSPERLPAGRYFEVATFLWTEREDLHCPRR
jgi:hypothetical protein